LHTERKHTCIINILKIKKIAAEKGALDVISTPGRRDGLESDSLADTDLSEDRRVAPKAAAATASGDPGAGAGSVVLGAVGCSTPAT
jgi:hypothetical protein